MSKEKLLTLLEEIKQSDNYVGRDSIIAIISNLLKEK
jgi:hypothetical protein